MHPLIRPLIRPAWTSPRIMPIENYQAYRAHLSCLSRGYLMGPNGFFKGNYLLASSVVETTDATFATSFSEKVCTWDMAAFVDDDSEISLGVRFIGRKTTYDARGGVSI